jgi:hypothetical protein
MCSGTYLLFYFGLLCDGAGFVLKMSFVLILDMLSIIKALGTHAEFELSRLGLVG